MCLCLCARARSRACAGKVRFEKEVIFVKDLVGNDGKFLTLDDFVKKYEVKVNYLDFYGCVSAVKQYMKKHNITLEDNAHTDNPQAFETLLRSPKGSRFYYDTIIGTLEHVKPHKTWNEVLNTELNWKNINKKSLKAT